jgi:hypothetical protein
MGFEELLARHGKPAFMEKAIPDLPPARRFSAVSIDCTTCGAASGTACGRTFCHERMMAVLQLARDGELEEMPEAEVTETDDQDDVADCQLCGRERNSRGSPLACSDGHQCKRRLTNGTRCRRVRMPADRYCRSHRITPHTPERWN